MTESNTHAELVCALYLDRLVEAACPDHIGLRGVVPKHAASHRGHVTEAGRGT